MKARDLVGKTVKKVHQSRHTLKEGAHVDHWAVDAIEFTDGSFLRFLGVGHENGITVHAIYPAREVKAETKA
jgi:hypothetical protein